MEAEPCICIAPDGVYVSTLHKRVLCKALSGPIKSLKDLEALIAELAPEKPLRSISFTGNEPPSVNSYNTFVVGPSQLGPQLPPTIGHVASTSTHEIYAYFLKRKSAHTVGEADKLIAQMLTDVSKGETAIVLTGKKEAQIAVKNSLMKRVTCSPSSDALAVRFSALTRVFAGVCARVDGQVHRLCAQRWLDRDDRRLGPARGARQVRGVWRPRLRALLPR